MPMSSESSARSSSGRVHESDVRPTAEQACKECRRRKSKVSRKAYHANSY